MMTQACVIERVNFFFHFVKVFFLVNLHGVVVNVVECYFVVSSKSSNALTFTFGLMPLEKL